MRIEITNDTKIRTAKIGMSGFYTIITEPLVSDFNGHCIVHDANGEIVDTFTEWGQSEYEVIRLCEMRALKNWGE